MAGEQLIQLMNQKGGGATDYADVVFGKVISIDPLKIQLSNQMILTDAFLTLGRHVTKHRDLVSKIKEHTEVFVNTGIPELEGKTITRKTVETYKYEIDESLKVDDAVVLLRHDGGQQFFVLEKSNAEWEDDD
ncbi:hypothetical protein FC83_GL000905 [Agrilactobacillus composti DSM 18527 = JCM 14202]|uniref:DUF2577 domain-containing protein n=1 Tax=Agrilactobacillus composti DSM 18527 = JCM 14202 TaxID=1423734 RepID=X0PGR7_9LACO|nr:DUF2577 domain-containing protein [Agrilactobacillus composti]KRM35602.1 hypothetical protein FC83_GL000905 [Agrilactobacillus composti DSM 18527 = JCM 14202]GAF41118.1 hypothetical protein JCM14202_3042 [Agrilactobacillus composti DSM 18527 = JCM 14202]